MICAKASTLNIGSSASKRPVVLNVGRYHSYDIVDEVVLASGCEDIWIPALRDPEFPEFGDVLWSVHGGNTNGSLVGYVWYAVVDRSLTVESSPFSICRRSCTCTVRYGSSLS